MDTNGWERFTHKLEPLLDRVKVYRDRLPSLPDEVPDPVPEAEFTAMLYEQAKSLEKMWGKIKDCCREHGGLIVPFQSKIGNDFFSINHHEHSQSDPSSFDRWFEKNHEDEWKGHLAYMQIWESEKENFRKPTTRVRISVKHPDDPSLERNK